MAINQKPNRVSFYINVNLRMTSVKNK